MRITPKTLPGLLLLLGLLATLPGLNAAYLKDAPEDPVVDQAGLLSEEQGAILRESIKELAVRRELYVFIYTTTAETSAAMQHEAVLNVHHWAPSGFAVVAVFNSNQEIEPLLTYSQDITVKLRDSEKASILKGMREVWRNYADPSEKVLAASRSLLRMDALWEPWFKEDPDQVNITRSSSMSSSEARLYTDDSSTISRPERLGGNAENVKQQESVFFDWQKQLLVFNVVVVLLIIIGAIIAFQRQRRADQEREDQMRRGAELLSPVDRNRPKNPRP